MAKKQFKNIHTIMEKVKKGELDFTSSSPRLYSNIQYNVRGEIIKPYLHYLDERALERSVDRFIAEPVSHTKIQQLAEKHNKKLISPNTLVDEMKKIYDKFPKEVINDIYNINYEDIHKLKFEDRSSKNRFRYQMIEKSNNPVAKVITRQNNIKSMIYTRGMVQYYLMMMAMLQQEDKSAFDDLMKNLQGQGDPSDGQGQPGNGQGQGKSGDDPGDGQGDQGNPSNQQPQDKPGDKDTSDNGEAKENSNPQKAPAQSGNTAGKGNSKQNGKSHLETLMQKFEQTAAGKQILNEVLDTAKKTTEMVSEVMTDKQLDDTWKDLSGVSERDATLASEKLNKDYLEKIEKELKKVSLNLSGIKSKIKNLLDRSVSYFSSREKAYFESIFDAGTMDGLEEIELLHPILRKLSIEDINVKETKKMGKIDIYIDASGSMNSGCGVRGEDGNQMTKLLFAKAFVYKMKEMDLLNKVFSFQSNVKYEGETMMDILSITGGGGTYTNNVISSIQKHGRNAIVLTDAEDSCNMYSEQAFFIGVQGAKFNSFHQNYLERKQAVVFDGKSVYNVDLQGHAII